MERTRNSLNSRTSGTARGQWGVPLRRASYRYRTPNNLIQLFPAIKTFFGTPLKGPPEVAKFCATAAKDSRNFTDFHGFHVGAWKCIRKALGKHGKLWGNFWEALAKLEVWGGS